MTFAKGHKLGVGNTYAKGLIPWNKGKKTGLAPWRGKKHPSSKRGPDIEKVCYTCGKLFSVRPMERKRKACSLKCRKSSHHGADNVNWKGGITSENKMQRVKFRRTTQRVVFRRDNYTCRICGKRGGKLHVDHIHSWAAHPELRFVEDNCRTLCMQCHFFVTFGRPLPDGSVWGHNLSWGE